MTGLRARLNENVKLLDRASLALQGSPPNVVAREDLDSAPSDQAGRGLAHVDMGAGGRPGDGPPRGDEGDPGGPQVLHEGSAVRAAGIQRHVERIAMIESHLV